MTGRDQSNPYLLIYTDGTRILASRLSDRRAACGMMMQQMKEEKKKLKRSEINCRTSGNGANIDSREKESCRAWLVQPCHSGIASTYLFHMMLLPDQTRGWTIALTSDNRGSNEKALMAAKELMYRGFYDTKIGLLNSLPRPSLMMEELDDSRKSIESENMKHVWEIATI